VALTETDRLMKEIDEVGVVVDEKQENLTITTTK
jgi:hypothetical protein